MCIRDSHRTGEDARARVARLALHQVLFGRIDRQGQRRQAVGGQVDRKDLHRAQRQRQPQQRRPGHQTDLADVGRQQIHQVLLDIAKDAAPLFDSGDDGGEVIVGQRHVCGFFGHVGAGDAHGDADVGLSLIHI